MIKTDPIIADQLKKINKTGKRIFEKDLEYREKWQKDLKRTTNDNSGTKERNKSSILV